MKKNPPLRFVKLQIINEIANHSLDLLDREKAGKITSAEFLSQSFPANAIQTIDKAIAKSIELFNSKESSNENW